MKNFILLISVFIFENCWSLKFVVAHSGRTASDGCHHDWKNDNGRRHCHGDSTTIFADIFVFILSTFLISLIQFAVLNAILDFFDKDLSERTYLTLFLICVVTSMIVVSIFF